MDSLALANGMPSSEPAAVRALVFSIDIDQLPAALKALLPEYRRMVNQAIRAGLASGATSRTALTRVVYADLSASYRGRSSYVVQAISDARAMLHAHRKRARRGKESRPPYVTRLFLKAAPKAFHFDAASGQVRVSVGNGTWVAFTVPVSSWHRAQLEVAGARPVLLTIKPGRVVITTSRVAPAPFEPEAVLALDTNEESLDGVLASGERAELVRVALGDVRRVQARHFVRRRRLASKKAHDRRVKRRLLAREGKRESDRVKSRLHLISKGLVRAASERKAAIVLEDLTGIRRFFSPRLNRRLTAWPHRELHRQISYKAHAAGVPLVFVNHYLTSQRCAACGWTPKRSKTRTSARRIGKMFVCGNPECGWRADRQFNAGVNILRTALTDRPGLGGIRFHLDALSRDVMNPLCEPAARAARGERMERESQTSALAVVPTRASTATGH
jgi:IS605 OrfB family transposase